MFYIKVISTLIYVKKNKYIYTYIYYLLSRECAGKGLFSRGCFRGVVQNCLGLFKGLFSEFFVR